MKHFTLLVLSISFSFVGSAQFVSRVLIDSTGTSSNFSTQEKALVFSDLNGDGYEDFIFSHTPDFWSQTDSVYAVINDQTNGFSQRTFIVSGAFDQIDLVDVNSDGFDDLLLSEANTLKYLPNGGTGNFGSPITISPANEYGAYRYLDADSDGDIDFLKKLRTGHFVLVRNNSNMSWSTDTLGMSFGEIILVNDLGYFIERIYNSPSQSFLLVKWSNFAQGQQIVRDTIISGHVPPFYVIQESDFDNDGDLDLFSLGQNDLELFENTNGSYALNQTINNVFPTPNLFGANFQLIDINSDGFEDVIINDTLDIFNGFDTLGSVYLLENLRNGSFGGSTEILQVGGFINSTFDGSTIILKEIDGDIDLFSYSEDKIIWHQNFTSSPYSVHGNVFYDANQNKVRDSSEYGVNGGNVIVTNSNLYVSFIDSTGGHTTLLKDSGDFQIQYNPDANWAISTDSTQFSGKLTALNPTASNLDFGIYPINANTAVELELTGGFPRCFRNVRYWVDLTNTGGSMPSGMLKLSLDTLLTFNSASLVPDSISGSTIFWDIFSLSFFEQKNFSVNVTMPGFTNLNDTLNSTIEFIENGTSYVAIDSLSQDLRCAYDPNDKAVVPVGQGSEGFIAKNQELEYLVRFQNTGNDTAINVIVLDQINSNLDLSTFELVGSSHAVAVRQTANRTVEFKFEDIYLVDSVTNETESHGFVKFKISPLSGLSSQAAITNRADIYFDFNPPILTNTTINTIECYDTTRILLSDTACGSFTWARNGQTYATTGIYSDTTSNELACDTIFSIDLQILQTYNMVVNSSVCPGGSYTFPDGTTQTNITSTATQTSTLQTADGCDSIIVTTVSVNPTFNQTASVSICSGASYTFPDGTTQSNITSASTQTSMLTTAQGCDSIILTTLSIDTINTSVTQNGFTLTSAQFSGTYQWMDCSSGTAIIIAGATNQFYTVTANGDYTVEVKNGICTDTSNCINVLGVGINNNHQEVNLIEIYPNPNDGNFKLDLRNPAKIVNIQIRGLRGKIIKEIGEVSSSILYLDLDVASGIYFVDVQMLNGREVRKFVVQ